MSDLFKSALGYFSGNNSSGQGNDLVGQIIEVGNVKLRVKNIIAEGGFAFVFVAQTVEGGTEYALKRLMAADAETEKIVIQEVNVLKKLSGHPNILKYISAAFVDKNQSVHGMSEFLLLTELCTGGSLSDVLNSCTSPLPPDIVCKVFWQTCQAVQHMHSQTPPIVHRDLKIENLLLGSDGKLKLCDFGSVITQVIQPNNNWTAQQRALLEDEMSRFTTPMYRPPEMIDTWSNYVIGPASDIWALGCLLYLLCYNKHPFEDSAKLRILNANYTIPPGDAKYSDFHPIIRGCLQVNPEQRMTVSDLLERLASIAETRSVNLRDPLKLECAKLDPKPVNNGPSVNNSYPHTPTSSATHSPQHQASSQPQQPHHGSKIPPPHPPPPQRPPPVSAQNPTSQPVSGSGGGLFSQIRGGAGSFLKNLKDTSSKVVQSVQQSMARNELDISYLTSRLAVMPFPAEGLEVTTKSNYADDVKMFLETQHHGAHYCVYNVSGRTYSATRLGKGRVVDCGWIGNIRRTPPLHALYKLCQDMYEFLELDPRNVCIVHCMDGKTSSAVLVCAFLMFVGLVQTPEDAAQIFAVKRMPPSFNPSEIRYLHYLADVLRLPPYVPHFHPLKLISITLQPVPLFNKNRDGCRPYIEIYQGDERIHTTQQEYERMTLFNITHGKITLPLNIVVMGDITIIIYHARHVLGRPTGIKILQLQINTGFTAGNSLTFNKSELDDLSEGEHYQSDKFSVVICVEKLPCNLVPSMPWADHAQKNYSHEILFSSKIESEETLESFVPKNLPPKRPGPPIRCGTKPPRPAPPPSLNTNRNEDSSAITVEEQETLIGVAEDDTGEADLLNLSSTNTVSVNKLSNDIDLLNINDSMSTDQTRDNNKVDLLNLGSEINSSDKSNCNKSGGMADLLGGFNDFVSSAPTPNVPVLNENNTPNVVTSSMPNSSFSFDPFGDTSSNLKNDISKPKSVVDDSSLLEGILDGSGWQHPQQQSSIPRNASTPNLNRDPFADLGNLGSNLRSTVSPGLSPQHRPSTWTPHPPTTPAFTPAGSPVKNAKSPCEPNYGRSHFDSAFKNSEPAGISTQKVPTKSGDVFGDLLGSQGYQFSSKKEAGPRTINEMRKEELAKDMDPDKLKVMEWVEGKKGNIRALLCSMHSVLWEDSKWRCEMHQLVSPADVKKAYRRACIAVHPDKHMGTPNEKIAKLIFVELNNAWSDFENDTTQQSIFH